MLQPLSNINQIVKNCQRKKNHNKTDSKAQVCQAKVFKAHDHLVTLYNNGVPSEKHRGRTDPSLRSTLKNDAKGLKIRYIYISTAA